MTCRICLEDGNLIQPCNCSGTAAYVHEECLVKWLQISERSDCEICKFEYSFSEVEERVNIRCPICYVSEKPDIALIVFLIGVVGFFISVFFSTFWGYNMEDMFLYINILQMVLIALFHEQVNQRETFLFWKCCSTMGLILVSLMYDTWYFTFVEAVVTSFFGLYTTIYLINNQTKQTVRYINIETNHRNEAVQGS